MFAFYLIFRCWWEKLACWILAPQELHFPKLTDRLYTAQTQPESASSPNRVLWSLEESGVHGHLKACCTGLLAVVLVKLSSWALSTFSPIGLRSSNGMRMCDCECVCVYGMNLKYAWHQFIPYYAGAIHKHTHTHILKPFEDSEPTGLKVDIASSCFWRLLRHSISGSGDHWCRLFQFLSMSAAKELGRQQGSSCMSWPHVHVQSLH